MFSLFRTPTPPADTTIHRYSYQMKNAKNLKLIIRLPPGLQRPLPPYQLIMMHPLGFTPHPIPIPTPPALLFMLKGIFAPVKRFIIILPTRQSRPSLLDIPWSRQSNIHQGPRPPGLYEHMRFFLDVYNIHKQERSGTNAFGKRRKK